MARPEERNVLQRLFELGEERVSSLTDELLSNPRFAEVLGNALRGALQTKDRVDRNMETVLSLLNVPSKADYKKLEKRVEALQGSLVNLNIKLDRILAAQKAAATKPKRSSRSAARRPKAPGPTSSSSGD